MWACPKKNILILAITLGVLVASGCSGHSVRTGTNSEGDGMTSSQNDNDIGLPGNIHPSNASGEGSGIHGGFVDGTKPHLRSSKSNSEETATVSTSTPLTHEEMGGAAKPFGGSNYGHQYPGVDGSGQNYGPLSGFGNGLASRSNPDPESWANAYLGNGQSSSDFYGDPSQAGKATRGPAAEAVTPESWAEKYAKEYGGPSPEHVKPDMNIARAQVPPSKGSVGIGMIDEDDLIVESSFVNGSGVYPGNVQDVYFAFDSWNISSEAARFLEEGAQWLHANPGKALTIEGHCDQRGTQDYNLVLGQKRAEAAREYLVNLGVHPGRIKIVSYGKERPFCQTENEDCFQENRRNHMVVRVQ